MLSAAAALPAAGIATLASLAEHAGVEHDPAVVLALESIRSRVLCYFQGFDAASAPCDAPGASHADPQDLHQVGLPA